MILVPGVVPIMEWRRANTQGEEHLGSCFLTGSGQGISGAEPSGCSVVTFPKEELYLVSSAIERFEFNVPTAGTRM